jgi:sortase A
VAGHRTPAIFWDLDKVKVGDAIVVETARTWYVYTVTQSHIVLPNAIQVVAPVPNKPGAKASAAMLTLTTCHPKYNNYQRLILHAQLARTQTRADGRPVEVGS